MIKICLTGGPGAGKSESVPVLKSYYEAKGFHIHFVPEAAAMLISMGLIPGSTIDPVEFQDKIMKTQLENERAIEESIPADQRSNTIVVFDRGLLDGNAYVSDEVFDRLLKNNCLCKEKIYPRYDQVYFLESAAIGARHTYAWMGDENAYCSTRMEDPETAVEVDASTRKCWVGHPNYHIIGCRSSFDAKMADLIESINAYLAGH